MQKGIIVSSFVMLIVVGLSGFFSNQTNQTGHHFEFPKITFVDTSRQSYYVLSTRPCLADEVIGLKISTKAMSVFKNEKIKLFEAINLCGDRLAEALRGTHKDSILTGKDYFHLHIEDPVGIKATFLLIKMEENLKVEQYIYLLFGIGTADDTKDTKVFVSKFTYSLRYYIGQLEKESRKDVSAEKVII